MREMRNPFGSVVYLQIRRQWLSVLYLGWSGRVGEWSGTPEGIVGFGPTGSKKMHCADDPAALTLVQPRSFIAFSHPRVLVHDLDDTAGTLRLYLKRASMTGGIAVARATFIVHVRDEWTGGISDVERVALAQICRGLGAGHVIDVDSTRELTPPELLQLVRMHPRGRKRPIATDPTPAPRLD